MARLSNIASVLIVALMLCLTSPMTSGQTAGAPSPGLDCSSVLVELLPCYQFLGNESVNTVSPACCEGLFNVSISSPVCLCSLISPSNVNQSASLGINVTRALELPGLCQLNIDPSSCSAIPVAAPSPLALGPSLFPAPVAPVVSPVLAPSPVPTLAPVVLPPIAPAPETGLVPSPSTTLVSAPSKDCGTAEASLVPCFEFVTGVQSTPSSSCCTSLDSLVTSSPTCLCSLVTSGSSALSGVNTTLALELPALCKVDVSLSSCIASPSPTTTGGGGPESPPTGRATVVAVRLFETIALTAAAFVLLLQQ